MAQLKAGSRHNRLVKRVTSEVGADNRVDEKKAEAAKFFGTGEGENYKPTYSGEAWVPYIAAGDKMSREEALKQIGTLIETLEHSAKADSLLVESAPTDAEGKPVLDDAGKPVVRKVYEGAVLGKLSVANGMKERHVLPGATDGMSAASYVCMLVKDALTLAHQQEMNGILRKQMWTDAQARGLAKAKAAGAGRTRTEEVA